MRAAALLLLTTTTACSLLIKGPPDPPTPSVEPDCTTSRAAPIADILGGTILGVVALATATGAGCMLCSSDKQQEAAESDRPWAIGYGLGAIGMVGIAVYGFNKTGRCAEAHELHDAFKTY